MDDDAEESSWERREPPDDGVLPVEPSADDHSTSVPPAAPRASGGGPTWDRRAAAWQSYRLPLGRRAGAVVWSEAFPTVVIAQGRPGSGKSTGYCAPALASWPGPVVCVSARYDLLDLTRTSRARRGPVRVYDPSGIRAGGDRYDLLGEVSDYGRAQQVAADVVQALPMGRVENEDFWRIKARQLLGPLLLAAAQYRDTPAPWTDLLRWASEDDVYEPRAVLAGSQVDGVDAAVEDLGHVDGLDPRIRSSVQATLSAALAPYRLPGVAASLGDGFTSAQVVDGIGTLYVAAPATEQRDLAALLTTVVGRVLRAAGERAARTDEPVRLLVVIDEAGSVARLPDLPSWTTTANGSGIALLTAFHSPAQMRRTYGADASEEIIDNSSAVVLLPGQSPSAAALLDAHAGNDVEDMPLGEGIRRLRSLRRGQAVVLRAGEEPTLVDVLAPWRDVDLGWDLGT